MTAGTAIITAISQYSSARARSPFAFSASLGFIAGQRTKVVNP
jgi:hypothetical protein